MGNLNPFEYYKGFGYKCFDIYHLLDIIFPNGGSSDNVDIYEKTAWAIKNNSYEEFKEAASEFFDKGIYEIGNHLNRISIGIERQQKNKLKTRKIEYVYKKQS